MFFLLFWKIAIIPKRAAVFISPSFFLSGLNSYHVILLHLIKILSMSNFIWFFLSFLLYLIYLFLWCVWFRLKVQRHKETEKKKKPQRSKVRFTADRESFNLKSLQVVFTDKVQKRKTMFSLFICHTCQDDLFIFCWSFIDETRVDGSERGEA